MTLTERTIEEPTSPPQRGHEPGVPPSRGKGAEGDGEPKMKEREVSSEVTTEHKKTALHGHPEGVSHNVAEGRRFVEHEPGEVNISHSNKDVNGFIP